jgi:KUP system potassium uptake protein
LEDDFDGQNRMNLGHFILSDDKKPQSDDDISLEGDYSPSYYYTMQNPSNGPTSDKPIKLREIQRIPTFVIFHKIASGKGVPHTFVGKFAFSTPGSTLQRLMHALLAFIRQWPSLPRVVVRI